MTLPQTPVQISTPKDSSLFFHLRDTELLVTEFPGCGTRFFLPITTCHATLSLPLSLSVSLPSLPFFLTVFFLPFLVPLYPRVVADSGQQTTPRVSPPADPTPRVNSDLLFLSPRERLVFSQSSRIPRLLPHLEGSGRAKINILRCNDVENFSSQNCNISSVLSIFRYNETNNEFTSSR